MPKYHVTTPQGTFEIDSPTELSDAEVYQHAQSQGAGESAASRGLSGFLSTSPLNPMNLVRAAAHPIDTVTSLVRDPLANLLKAGGDIKDVITGDSGDRTISALNAVKHIGGSVPLIGPAGINAGEKIGEGNYAGAAGDAANIALSLLPLKKFAPGAISAAVEGGARTGASVARGVGAAADLAAEGLNHPLIGAKVPYGIAKLTSKLANKTAPALDAVAENSLESRTPQAVNRFKTIRPSREIPYRYNGELPETTTPEPTPSPVDRYSPNTSGIPDNGVGPRPMTPFELWQQENPMGAGRNTYTAQPGETPPAGSLADLAKLSRYPTPEAAMTDLADSYGHGLQAEPSFIDSLPEVPEFEYTGSADYLPGESTGPGVSSSAEQNLLNSPSFRKLTSLNRR
jgi:hypothetical protein